MTLTTRLALAFTAIAVAIASTLVVGGQYAMTRYFQEVNQELNRSIAMYVVDRLDLLGNGGVNQEQLGVLADRAMTLNPAVEVYLLDPTGRILAHALAPETILMDVVDLAPVHAFLAGAAAPPILGDNPRNPDADQAFSAFPIDRDDERLGYLYVVLGGKQFESVLGMFENSYVIRLTSVVGGATLLVALVFGFWLVRHQTAPFAALQRAVRGFGEAGFTGPPSLDQVETTSHEVRWLKDDIEQMIARLGQQYAALDASDRVRRELIANVSHDLRTPLASIQGYLETIILKGDELDADEHRRFLDIAHRHSKRLAHLINELFELARLDSGIVDLAVEPFSLTELLHDVVLEFELQAKERGITLRFERTNVYVRGDIALIQRVLENLIGNALRFTPRNGNVVVGIAIDRDEARISVRDDGIGIAESDLPLIFDRYYSSRATAVATGTEGEPTASGGLGLAIVKRILQLHDQPIEVASAVDQGTTFTFSLARA